MGNRFQNGHGNRKVAFESWKCGVVYAGKRERKRAFESWKCGAVYAGKRERKGLLAFYFMVSYERSRIPCFFFALASPQFQEQIQRKCCCVLKEKAYVLLSKTQRHFIMVECSPNFYLCLSGLIENVVTLRDEFSHWSAFCGCKLVELNTVIASCYNVLLEVAPA